MADDVEHAAALQPRRILLALEMHRDREPHMRTFGETQEIDMNGTVAHGIGLQGAWDHACFLAPNLQHERRGQERALARVALKLAVVNRYSFGLFLAAVDDPWHGAFAPRPESMSFARALARFRAQ